MATQSALGVSRKITYVLASQSQKPNGSFESAVPVIGGQDANGRSAVESLPFDVPSTFGKQRMTRRGETSGVRHLASTDQREAGLRGQPKNFLEPRTGHLFGNRGRGRAGIHCRILI